MMSICMTSAALLSNSVVQSHSHMSNHGNGEACDVTIRFTLCKQSLFTYAMPHMCVLERGGAAIGKSDYINVVKKEEGKEKQ